MSTISPIPSWVPFLCLMVGFAIGLALGVFV